MKKNIGFVFTTVIFGCWEVLKFLWMNSITIYGIALLILSVVYVVKHIKTAANLKDSKQKKDNYFSAFVFSLLTLPALFVIYLGWTAGTSNYFNV